MKFAAFSLLSFIAAANGIELTPDNWDAETAGKTVFLKMFAPWCGHCKKMKPDWDKLMDEFKDNPKILVGDVDCTADGKPLCDSAGVKGFPTLKHGDPSNLEDYQGGRDFSSLQKFAKEFKPVCSPTNIDLCDDDKKAEIKKFQDMPTSELDALIEAEEKKLEDAEEEFKAAVQELQDKYQSLSTEKDEKTEAVKAAGLGLMKAVKASAGKEAKDEL